MDAVIKNSFKRISHQPFTFSRLDHFKALFTYKDNRIWILNGSVKTLAFGQYWLADV